RRRRRARPVVPRSLRADRDRTDARPPRQRQPLPRVRPPRPRPRLDPGTGRARPRLRVVGSGNDLYALGYYRPGDLPFTSPPPRRFTVCDRSFASVLGPTYPNRQYLLSAQSGGRKTNSIPAGGFEQTSIIEPLVAAGVSVGCYYADVPSIALF